MKFIKSIKYSKNGGNLRVVIDTHNVSLYLNISINFLKSILILCLLNFLLYKIYNLYMKFMNKIDNIYGVAIAS